MVSRLKILIAEKEVKEKRKISLRLIHKETGISLFTLGALANNTLRQLPITDLEALCRFLGCTPNDLLVADANDDEKIILDPCSTGAV